MNAPTFTDISRDDVEVLADAIVECFRVQPATEVTPEVIPIEQLDLEALSTSLAGVTDPIGQLKKWLEELLKSIADWIVTGIKKFIEKLKEAIKSLIDGLSRAISDVAKAVSKVFNAVSEGVSSILKSIRYLAKAIVLGFESILDAISNIVTKIADKVSEIIDKVTETIADLVKGVVDVVTKIGEKIAELITTGITKLGEAISSGIKSIIEGLSELGKRIGEAISGIVDAISRIIGEVVDFIKTGFEKLIEGLSKLGETISKIVEGIVKAISEGIKTVISTIQNVIGKVVDAIGQIGKAVAEMFGKVVEAIQGFAKSVVDFVKAGIESVIEGLKTLGSTIVKLVTEAFSKISEAISGIAKSLVDFIKSGFEALLSGLRSLGATISDAVGKLASTITKAIGDVVDFIRKGFDTIVKAVGELANTIGKIVTDVASTIIKGVTELGARIVEFVRTGFETLAKGIARVVEAIKSMGEVIVKTITNLDLWSKMFKPVFDFIRDKIIAPFIETTKSILASVTKGLDLVSARLTGFINAIMNFPTWFREHLVKPLVEGLSNIFKPVTDTFKVIAEGLDKVVDAIVNVITKPGEFLKRVQEVFEAIWGGIVAFGKFISKQITDLVKTLGGVLIEALKTLADIGITILKRFFEAVSTLVKSFTEALTKRASPTLAETIAGTVMLPIEVTIKYWEDNYKRISEMKFKELFKSPLVWFYQIMNAGLFSLVVIYGLKHLVKAWIEAIPNPFIELLPLGIGARINLRLRNFIRELFRILDRVMPDVARYFIIGHMIWWGEPTRAITRYWLTNALTIELPPMEQTLTSVRRHLVTPLAREYYEMFKNQLRMGGIYQGFIDNMYPLPEKLLEHIRKGLPRIEEIYDKDKLAVVIKDRFESPRVIPTTLIASLPTPSELSRMMIRDIILEPKYFKTVMAMHGYHPDIAFMYYLLHFRYPSPEKLWEFVSRGIAGMLWYEPTKADIEEATNLLREFGLDPRMYMPSSPTKFNLKGKVLLNALTKYMKWHDYLPFSWLSPKDIGADFPFTSDNMIVKDVVVDIPTKIDVRWMTKWAIFDFMSEKIDPQKAPAKDFLKILEDSPASREITMDLVLMCRLLQATGLHPYYVPVVAVAESINALADERTLLRTGFINLYKEGFFDYETLDKLLKGFFIASFKVAYYDFETEQWIPKWINLPVRFLPAERKLLELRAIFDRALDVLRDYMRMLGRGVTYLIYKPEEAIEKLKAYVKESMNKWFKEEVKSITGKELELTVDEKWAQAYIKYFEQLRDMETFVRARYYARYLIYHIIRRFERGYLTKEEAKKLLDTITEKLKESPIFKELLELVSEFTATAYVRELRADAIISRVKRRKISKEKAVEELVKLGLSREVAEALVEAKATPYSISLTSLGTLLEIVPEALEYAIGSLELFGFNPEEYKYWVTYIARKPFKDELTLVRTRIYRVLEKGIAPDKLVEILKAYMVKPDVKDTKVTFEYGDVAKKLVEFYNRAKEVFEAYGISPPEWVLYNLIARLEREEEALKEYIPTPSTLATMREYMLIPEELIEKVFEVKHVPPEWRKLWKKYIEVKPLANDVRAMLTSYRRAKVLDIVPKEIEEKVIELAKLVGYTDEELKVLELRITLEELIRNAREYIPTPMMLATLSEYLVLPEELVDEALKLRRVPEKWFKFWKQYIKVRPLADDIRALLTSYRRAKVLGVLPEDLEKKIRELAKQVGYTEEELKILDLRITVEELIRSAREYIPTPMMLATMSEYVIVPEKLVEKAMKLKRVPEEWVEVWKKYIAVRPLGDDIRGLMTAYRRAKVLGVLPEELEKKILEIAELVGWTDKEFKILDLRVKVEELIRKARVYVPTPTMLATISEYIPEARKFISDVLKRRNVPQEYWSMWAKYINIRPLMNDIRRLFTAVERLYVYFFVKPDDYKKFLETLKPLGYEVAELDIIKRASDFMRTYQAFRNVIGTPRQLVTMAEYSPKARKLALGQVYKMIDALPVDPETKEFLKAMWEEYIKVRPVYDEVRRYVTELISDYAEGLIDKTYLEKELNDLKEWGLDDMEIDFYLKLAEKRRARYELRRARYQRY